jgi:hypothetical protein
MATKESAAAKANHSPRKSPIGDKQVGGVCRGIREVLGIQWNAEVR